MSDISQIGSSIRSLRKSKEITLQQMSKETGLSIGYLSNLERNLCSPTLQNIQKICEVFGSSITDLLERNAEARIVVRKKDREISEEQDSHVRRETINFGTGNSSFFYMVLEAGCKWDGSWRSHDFDEVGTVISGKLMIRIEEQKFELQEGDCILIKAHSRHCYENPDPEVSVSYWARFGEKNEKL